MQVKHLEILRPWNSRNLDFAEDAGLWFKTDVLRALTNLQQLTLQDVTFTTDQIMREVARLLTEHCPNLSKISTTLPVAETRAIVWRRFRIPGVKDVSWSGKNLPTY